MVDDFFFEMRAHLASGCADDLALWLGADRSLQPKEAHFLALLTQATGVDAATRLHERRPVAPPTLASLRHALREMGALLSRHAHMVRVNPPNLNPNPNPNPNPGALLSRHRTWLGLTLTRTRTRTLTLTQARC